MPVEHEEFGAEALRLVEEAERAGIRLRVLGSIAYRIHCPGQLHLFEQMVRDLTDIDLAGDRTQSAAVERFMVGLGYVEDRGTAVATEGKRLCFTRADGCKVDVFMDELYFCHRIPLRDRLALDAPTITVTDLLLEKMQIVEINLKDLKDTVVLLLEHDLAERDAGIEQVDCRRLCELLRADWGFYHTVTVNLGKMLAFAAELDALAPEQRTLLRERTERLLRILEAEPKPLAWRMRARVGTRVRWYQEVSTSDAIFLEDQR